MDALSDILRSVNLEGAVFFHARFTAPWRFESPHASRLARALAAKTAHLILYHYVSEGECTVLFEGLPPIRLYAGDVILIPHGDAHAMASSASAPSSARMDVQALLQQRPHVLEHGGGGEAGRLICGYLACDPRLLWPVLDALPRAVTVSLRQGGESHWLERSILDAVDEASSPKPGGDTVLAKLSEVMVVETLRRYIAQLQSDQPSWLGGLRDRMVGRCLALMHERPGHAWTVDSLAKTVGVSRSGLAERFTHFVGQPPMQYLGKWRMALAANYLSSTTLSLTRIAEEVGYDTAPAFNRAFRREHGMPPATWRHAHAQAARPAAASPGNRAPG